MVAMPSSFIIILRSWRSGCNSFTSAWTCWRQPDAAAPQS
jgi:hypothetical protein